MTKLRSGEQDEPFVHLFVSHNTVPHPLQYRSLGLPTASGVKLAAMKKSVSLTTLETGCGKSLDSERHAPVLVDLGVKMAALAALGDIAALPILEEEPEFSPLAEG